MNKAIILYFHSVAPFKHPSWIKNYLTLSMHYFEDLIKYLINKKYQFINLDKYFDIKSNTYCDKQKYVCLTFDDGYLDNFIYVYPLLKKYNAKATIFVNPVFVDKRSIIRKTLEDYWNNKASMEEINRWGFLSWDEMRLMEKSGIVDIQSHTLTHTKYFSSDNLIAFHHPGADCLYYVGNEYPEKLPYYIEDREFEKLLPYGYPIFEQKSSIIAHKVNISQYFKLLIMELLKKHDWSSAYNYNELLIKVKTVYEEAKKNNLIIESIEAESEYKNRVEFELRESKRIIQNELGKNVEFCCWPHGDYDQIARDLAFKTGYKATTVVVKPNEDFDDSNSFSRLGISALKNNKILTRWRYSFNINYENRVFPFYQMKTIYYKLRYNF